MFVNGVLAHLVERFVRNEEVGSSSLLCSTLKIYTYVYTR